VAYEDDCIERIWPEFAIVAECEPNPVAITLPNFGPFRRPVQPQLYVVTAYAHLTAFKLGEVKVPYPRKGLGGEVAIFSMAVEPASG